MSAENDKETVEATPKGADPVSLPKSKEERDEEHRLRVIAADEFSIKSAMETWGFTRGEAIWFLNRHPF